MGIVYWYNDQDYATLQALQAQVFVDAIVQHPTVQEAREIIMVCCQSGNTGGVCQQLSQHRTMQGKLVMGCQTNATPSGTRRIEGRTTELNFSVYSNGTNTGVMAGSAVM